MQSPAYLLLGKSLGDRSPRELKEFARLQISGTWCGSNYQGDLGSGTVVWLNGHDRPNLKRKDWIDCSDGLKYLGPDILPTQAELCRPNIPAHIDVTTVSGRVLSIPLATAAPRHLSFSTGRAGKPATEYGCKAYELFDRLALDESVTLGDPLVIEVITLAIATAYSVTPELLDQLEWITDQDVNPILSAIMGNDPKALDAAGITSP